MALQEEEKTNKWKKQDICIGSTKACAFPGMISSYSKFIISFAEDEAGRHCASHTFIGNYCQFCGVGKMCKKKKKKLCCSSRATRDQALQNRFVAISTRQVGLVWGSERSPAL